MGRTWAVAALAAVFLAVAGSGASPLGEWSPSIPPPSPEDAFPMGPVVNQVGTVEIHDGPTVPRRGGSRGSRALYFEGWNHGPHYGQWSSINFQEIDGFDGNPAPSLPLGGGVQSLISLARRFRTHRGLRIAFDLKVLTGRPIPPGYVLGMDLRESPYSNLEQVASLEVDAFRGVVEYSFPGQPTASYPFPVDDAWHRFTLSIDRNGNAAWYRDAVLQTYATGLPTRARLELALWGGDQESRIDNIRVRSAR